MHVTYFEVSEKGWKAESEQNSTSSRRKKRAGCSSTDQPHHHGVVAHVSSRVQAGHAVVGPQVDVGAAVVHQVLRNMQVPLLAGQVERGGAGERLSVHTAVCTPTQTNNRVGVPVSISYMDFR